MPITEITTLEQFQDTISGDKFSLVEFSTSGCPVCRTMMPVVDRLESGSNSSVVAFYRVDAHAQTAAAAAAGVRTLPSFVLYKAGVKVGSSFGASPSGLEILRDIMQIR